MASSGQYLRCRTEPEWQHTVHIASVTPPNAQQLEINRVHWYQAVRSPHIYHISAPIPMLWATLATLSTEVYWSEQSSGLVRSLRIASGGKEPIMQPVAISQLMYYSITSGCSHADGEFRLAGTSRCLLSKPIRKPCHIPRLTPLAIASYPALLSLVQPVIITCIPWFWPRTCDSCGLAEVQCCMHQTTHLWLCNLTIR